MWRADRSSRVAIAGARLRRAGLRRTRRGLSLLEAVAALAIVGATSAGVLAATGAGVRTAERSRRAHEAEALAEEQLALVTVAGGTTLPLLPDSLAHGVFAPPFDEYSWDVTVQPDATLPGLYAVQVDVTWAGGAQSLQSALYRRPPGRAGGAP